MLACKHSSVICCVQASVVSMDVFSSVHVMESVSTVIRSPEKCSHRGAEVSRVSDIGVIVL